MKISYHLTLILLVILFVAFNYRCKEDPNDIKNINLHFYYQNETDITDILEFLNNFVEPSECNKNIYNRYDIGLQYLKAFHSDTIIPKPKFAKTVDDLNINRHKNYSRKALREFVFANIHNSDTILSNNYDSIYSAMALNYDNLLFFNEEKYLEIKLDSINMFNNTDSLANYIKRISCSSGKDVNIVWNPKKSKDESDNPSPQKTGSSIVILPPDIGKQNIRYNELIARSKSESLNWKEWYELASLSAELNKTTNLTWDYLNTAAKRAIAEKESEIILDDLLLDITQRRFGGTLTKSQKWKGLIEGLKGEDISLIGLELGSNFKVGTRGCYSITLLSQDLLESPPGIDPNFRITTKTLSHTGSITFDLLLFIKEENQWESRTNINLASGEAISLEYNKAKAKVTIVNNTVSGNTYILMCVGFSKIDEKETIGKGENDNSKPENQLDDNDHDGFIGYLDINDNDKKKFPELKLGQANLGDNINIQVTNGNNLDDVDYKWLINGNEVKLPYNFKEIGCFDVRVIMTHIPTGKVKELSSPLHIKLPISDLDRDLNAILRVGLYTPPARPTSNEVRLANEAEERVLSYFAAGCAHNVINQFNQQKSVEEFLVADLRGANGKINNVKVKSIEYKNNGCNKICSFTYVISQ